MLKNRLIYLTTLYESYEITDDDFLVAQWIRYFQYTRQKGDDYIRFLLEKKFSPQNVFSKTEVKLDSITTITEIRDQNEEDYPEDSGIEEKSVMRAKLAPKEISDYVKSLQSASVQIAVWKPRN